MFTRVYQGSFYVGVMRPDGSGERMLSQGFGWWASTERRTVVFFLQTGSERQEQLHGIDLTGYNERVPRKHPLDGSDQAWSPLWNQYDLCSASI